MRTNCCHRFLAFNVKFLNFLQLFLGISVLIYSAYLLNQWGNSAPLPPPPPNPAPVPVPALSTDYLHSLWSNSNAGLLEFALHFDGELSSGSESGFVFGLRSVKLPAPWFIYLLMAVGILLCCMSCIGHIAAEAINGCCLCFYIILSIVLILMEVALVTFIASDRRWEKDLPYDPTGELDKLRSFVEANADICKWVGITLLVIQALTVLLSFVLRAIISTRRADCDEENNYAAAGDRIREPLLNSQQNQPSASVKGEGRSTLSDIWTTRIRQKYGLDNKSTKYQSQNQNASPSTIS